MKDRAARSDSTRAADARFAVRRSATGLGIFATRPIPADTRLLEYTGPRLTLDEANRLRGRYLMELPGERFIDGRGRDNVARYVNHSCRPNCEIRTARGRAWIWSIEPIAEGEELAYDYGQDYISRLFKDGCKCPTCLERKK